MERYGGTEFGFTNLVGVLSCLLCMWAIQNFCKISGVRNFFWGGGGQYGQCKINVLVLFQPAHTKTAQYLLFPPADSELFCLPAPYLTSGRESSHRDCSGEGAGETNSVARGSVWLRGRAYTLQAQQSHACPHKHRCALQVDVVTRIVATAAYTGEIGDGKIL